MTSTLRERQQAMTRDSIIDAVAEIVVEQGGHAFSTEDVADRAGVSLRTVYRYFPSREELLLGVGERLTEHLDLASTAIVGLEDALQAMPSRYAAFSEHDHLARATAALVALAEQQPSELTRLTSARHDRHTGLRKELEREFPEMPEECIDQILGLGRLIGSIVGWSNLTGSPSHLSGESAGIAAQWALQTLLKRVHELEDAGVRSLSEDLS